MSFPKARLFPSTAHVNAYDHLVIGGCDVVQLAQEFGTPLYVLDEVDFRNRCREFLTEFRNRLPETSVLYAGKAFINPALARIIHQEGMGLDVVSGGELAVAQTVEFPSQDVYFHGNNKGPAELTAALEWDIGCVVVDNYAELELLDRLAGELGKLQKILLRVSPGIDPHTHIYTTTGILDSKFGFPLDTDDAAKAVRQGMDAKHLDLVGLHFHLGSPIFELEPYRLAIRVVLGFAAKLANEGFRLQELSPGGGFAIAYTEEQRPPSVAHYADAIIDELKAGCYRERLPMPRLVIEPGRAIVGPAGVALYQVGSMKNIPGIRKYVSVDGGMGDNIRPALYGASYEAAVADQMSADPVETITIAGKFCESGDVLVRDIPLPLVKPGSFIALPASGAYGLSMASGYNLNPRPPIILVCEGQATPIRRRETYADLMQCDVF